MASTRIRAKTGRSSTSKAKIPASGPLEPDQGVRAFRVALEGGEPWYRALLDVVGRWVAAEETVDGVEYQYLIAGEAFDWLRLAERLLATVADLVPQEEVERLLFFGDAPDEEDEFARAIGPQKHRAHLNFQYGVIVEEALLLSAEQELNKAGTLTGARGAVADVAAYERVYGWPLDELLVMYRAEEGAALGERVTLAELRAFTYWCSKYRFRTGEPARVASDTRKALALLSSMEANRSRRGDGDGAMTVPVKSKAKRRRRR